MENWKIEETKKEKEKKTSEITLWNNENCMGKFRDTCLAEKRL